MIGVLCEGSVGLGGASVGCLRTNASNWVLWMKAVGWDGPGTGTHLELESKLRACLIVWSPSLLAVRILVFSGEGFAVCSRLVGKGRAHGGGPGCSPSRNGGRAAPLFSGDKCFPWLDGEGVVLTCQ